jgi:hypothetical protein
MRRRPDYRYVMVFRFRWGGRVQVECIESDLRRLRRLHVDILVEHQKPSVPCNSTVRRAELSIHSKMYTGELPDRLDNSGVA